MAINPDDPFGYGSSWGQYDEVGATNSGDDIEIGDLNCPDPADATRIFVPASKNAALFVENKAFGPGPNFDPGDGGVGMFGQSFSTTRGIGVAGECEAGCGAYGISPADGVGVVGRCMSGHEVEKDMGVEQLTPRVGVLGHSMKGPGVRGHGGPLLTLPQDPLPPVVADPGGVFSSGQLQDTLISEVQDAQEVSLDSLAQLRLIPSVNAKLPAQAQLGDFYFVMTFQAQWAPGVGPSIGQLWLCTQIQGTTPLWQRVQMDANLVAAGSPVPQG